MEDDLYLALKEAYERTGKTDALILATKRIKEILAMSPEEFEQYYSELYRRIS